jgi:Ser/Thr protein kinase RdoA (MazF antagonist)
MPMEADEIALAGGGRSVVSRRGEIVYRPATAWSATVIALLKHLEREGFAFAPRVVGNGFSPDGRETVYFIEGEFVHPRPWTDEALPLLGRVLRQLHDSTSTFVAPPTGRWRPWFGRNLGHPTAIGHCDTGSWNIVARAGLPIALIDWEQAGPVDPIVEVAQACWLNAQLFDDDIAEREGLGSPEARARQMRMLLDGYGLTREQRAGFVDTMRDFVVLCAANEVAEAGVTPQTIDASALWAIGWRARSAAWIVRHADLLARALV